MVLIIIVFSNWNLNSFYCPAIYSVRQTKNLLWLLIFFVCWKICQMKLYKYASSSNIEQVLAATPHKTPTIRQPASHHENWVRWTRHAGHCWRSKDELISDVLLWTPTYGWAKAGWLAWTYIQQLCEDTGCSPEDLPEVMNDTEKWRERVRDIHAHGMMMMRYIVSIFTLNVWLGIATKF